MPLPEPGSPLGEGDVLAERYVIESLLGRGGMGEVYAARDRRLRRRVAIKTIHATGGDATLGGQRLRAEAEMVAQLGHPGIVAIYDVLEEESRVLLVMELVEGASLRDRIERAPMPPAEVGEVVSSIASALAAAHDHGLVHRDVKPDNVMLRPDGRIALLDFGIAKTLASPDPTATTRAASALTEPGTVSGTTMYLAPEQARGEAVSGATDQFALAVTAFELLTGHVPWPTETVARLVAAIVQDAPPPLLTARGAEPLADAVLARALAKDPADRYPTVSEFASSLALALAPGDPQAARTAPPPQRATASARAGATTERGALDGGSLAARAPRRWTRRVAWGGSACAALLAGYLLVRAPPRPSSPAPDPALAPSAPAAAHFRLDELPASRTSVAEAAASYHRALRHLARGEASAATAAFDAALAADPDLASAHLQRLLHETYYCPTKLAIARPHFTAARRGRDALTDRDRELLDALEPAVLDPPDLKEVAVRLRALAARRPGDAQIWDALGVAENKLFHFGASAGAIRRAMSLAPDDSLPGVLVLAQDVGGAEHDRVIDECVGRNAAAEWCRSERCQSLILSGACTELEREARAISALEPTSAAGRDLLASALAGQGAPAEAVELSLVDRRALLPEAARARAQAADEIQLAIWRGDFEAALRRIELAAGTVDPSLLATWKVEALRETGDARAAGEAALAYLRRAAALPRFERPESDPLPVMLARARASGALPEAELTARREAWIDGWRARLDDEAWASAGPVVWALSFSSAPTREQARAALARLPSFGPLPPIADRQFWTHDGPTGELLRLAGRLEDAVPRLRGEAGRCNYDMRRVQAQLGLGRALEEQGDRAGACASYAAVLAQWGAARPRSTSADEARDRSRSLGCPAGR